MPFTTSPAALVVTAPATLSGVRLALPGVDGSPIGDGRRLGTRLRATAGAGTGLRHGLSPGLRVLGGFGEMLVVAYAFPLVILAIGIPIALFVRLIAEAGRALWQL
jgi:hypothetical protein